MKIKSTAKSIRNAYHTIIKVGYCDLQDMLCTDSPIAYTCGVYGWNADVYDMGNGVAICTGYRPFGNVTPDFETVQRYEKRAREARRDLWNPDELREYMDALKAEFVQEVR